VPAPAPQHESVQLANELVYLHPDNVERLRQLRFRLGHLVRNHPDDQAARLGLASAAFLSGEREPGLKQLDWLKGNLQTVDGSILSNLVHLLIMTGQLSCAREALDLLRKRAEWPGGPGKDPATVMAHHVVWAHFIGAPDVAHSLTDKGNKARLVQQTIEENGLETPLEQLGNICARLLGSHACSMQLTMNIPLRRQGAALFFVYRLAEPDERRDEFLAALDHAWEEALTDSGYNMNEMDEWFAVDVVPLPAVRPVQA